MPLTSPTHDAAFYVTDRYLVDRIAAFVSDGLRAGEHVLVVATNAHWTAVAESLDDLGVAHGRAAEQGRLVVADAEEVLDHITVDGKASADRFREMLMPLLNTAQQQRLYGEVVALLVERGEVDAAAAIEALGHEISHERGIQILCSYRNDPTAPLSASDMSRLSALHDHTVIESAPQSAGHFHAVRFYNDAAELSGIVSTFLAEGLSGGSPALLIATPPHREAIVAGLQARGIDAERFDRDGQFVALDAETVLSAFMIDGMPDAARFRATIEPVLRAVTQQRPGATIRAYGEMVDVLWRQGRTVAAVRLEMLWNELAKSNDFSLLCGYSMGQFYKDADLSEVRRHHSHAIDAEGRSIRIS